MPVVVRVDAKEAQRLLADSVPFVDVLPPDVFAQEHLPGARNVPLATFEPAQLDSLDRAEPLLVYCFDQH
jgi:rhodanese-related sulfurtransferase